MPYPLTGTSERVDGRRRVLPPLGCPGLEEWVLPVEVQRWLEMGFRLGSVPAQELELFWMPSARRWNEDEWTAAIELTVDPHGIPVDTINVNWGDGSIESMPWVEGRTDIPLLRHVYASREDLTVTVTMGAATAQLEVALIGCPVPPWVGTDPTDPGNGSSRGTRWYSGDGPPPEEGLYPKPAPGDFYLDGVSGLIYELEP